LVRVRAPLGTPGSGSQVDRHAAVIAGGWTPPSCAAGYRCYAFSAARPGLGQVAAMTPSGCLKDRGCILGLTALRVIYVVPRRCPSVSVVLVPPPGRRDGSLTITPRRAAGYTNRLVRYTLGSFTDSDREPHPILGDYAADIDWGDGLAYGGSIVRARRGHGFEIEGEHFYCGAGARAVTVTLSKTPASLVHDMESVRLTYRVRSPA
jgi:hypothetical protein